MDESILTTIKALLGLDADYDVFDGEILVFINTSFLALRQLGVSSAEGFSVKDETATWVDLLGDTVDLDAVKSYIYIKVRLLFDPPSSSYVLDAFTKQLAELEFRINVTADPYVAATPTVLP